MLYGLLGRVSRPVCRSIHLRPLSVRMTHIRCCHKRHCPDARRSTIKKCDARQMATQTYGSALGNSRGLPHCEFDRRQDGRARRRKWWSRFAMRSGLTFSRSASVEYARNAGRPWRAVRLSHDVTSRARDRTNWGEAFHRCCPHTRIALSITTSAGIPSGAVSSTRHERRERSNRINRRGARESSSQTQPFTGRLGAVGPICSRFHPEAEYGDRRGTTRPVHNPARCSMSARSAS